MFSSCIHVVFAGYEYSVGGSYAVYGDCVFVACGVRYFLTLFYDLIYYALVRQLVFFSFRVDSLVDLGGFMDVFTFFYGSSGGYVGRYAYRVVCVSIYYLGLYMVFFQVCAGYGIK